MKESEFSIIIPTLNEEQYLPRLLAQIEAQTYSPREVCIIDARSVDTTVAEARKFSSSFTQKGIGFTILSSTKRSASYQRNKGAQKAVGKYLIFFDADVQIVPEFLKLLYSQMRSSDVDACTVYTKSDTHYVKDRLVAKLMNDFLDVSLILKNPFFIGHCIIVRKKAFDAVGGFDESIQIGEDFDLSKRLFRANYRLKIYKSPKLIASMRRYRRDGHLMLSVEYLRMLAHIVKYRKNSKKALRSLKFDYPMGGACT